MTVKHILLLSACAALMGCGGNSPSNEMADIEAAQSKSAQLEIDYEKFTLENGLDVILQVDRSDPIVAFTTVIHAGSNREKPGRTGFAHFFEHMAFNDSENVPRGWNRKAIPDWGGSRNGGTWSDGTIYYEVVPKDAFDKILWIDSDRLGYMINTVTNEALEREKQVVKNEKRQRVDNAAYGYTSEIIKKALYPEGHPYSWTVIGSLPDLQAATLDDLREFYDEYYGAANATLSIVGDIDIKETKEKVERWFGEIRRGPDIKPLAPMPVKLDASQKLYFEDNFAKLPELRLTFPTVESLHPDEHALDLLGQILGGSKNSAIYKTIVQKEKLAPRASSYNRSSEIAGEFVMRVRANAGKDLDDVYAALKAAMADFEANGVDPKDLQRIKAEQETILYSGLSTVLGKSRNLAQNNEFARDPAYSIKEAEKIQAVTAEDIMRVYGSYIKDRPSIMTSVVPKGQSQLALEGSDLATVWIETVTSGVAANEDVSAGAVADFEKTPSKYDRSEPPFGELPLVKMPDVWTAQTDSGLPVLGIENSETPLVSFQITFDGGAALDDMNTRGGMDLLTSLMNEGTSEKSPAELEQAIGLLGSGIGVSTGYEEVTLSGTCLARNFEATLDIVKEILERPRFELAEFTKVKSAALTSIKGREANPNSIAARAFRKQLYGMTTNEGAPISGTESSVNAITLDTLKSNHAKLLKSPVTFHIAGAISKDRAVAAFNDIGLSPQDATQTRRAELAPALGAPGTVYFIDVPGSKQSVLNIGRVTVPADHPDAIKINVANQKLGGGISGDLSQMLRIEKGYTYGAYSSSNQSRARQSWRLGTSVRANATGPSLAVIKDMLESYGPNFDEAAVKLTQNKRIKDNTRAFESLGAKLGTLRQISKYGKSQTYIEDEQAKMLAMDVDDYKAIAGTYFDPKRLIWVVVGDKETQFGPVQEFAKTLPNPDVIELDIDGAVVR